MKSTLSFIVSGAIAATFLLSAAAIPELLLPAFIGYVSLTALSTAFYDYTRRPAMGT